MNPALASRPSAAVEASPRPSCWVVTEGHIGMEIQCSGLADAAGLAYTVRRVQPHRPWKYLPPAWWPAPLDMGVDGAFTPPWPEVLIACGRCSLATLLAVRRESRRERGPAAGTFCVFIQNPLRYRPLVDLVVAPAHDRVRGDNVVQTVGSMHGLTASRLHAAAARSAPALAHLPRPLIGVLVGGSNRRQTLSAGLTEELAARLARLAREHRAGLVVTPSRRTGEENVRILRERLAGPAGVVWDGSGENPYLAYLGLADVLVVTGDSVNMVSEAASTGKPVYVFDLPGGGKRHRAFHESLRAAGVTRPLGTALETWRYAPLDETTRVAGILRQRLHERALARQTTGPRCT